MRWTAKARRRCISLSQNGHTRVVHLLLVKGALLHRDHKGRTPLHYAVTNGFTHTMEQLLAVHSPLAGSPSDRDGNTALHLAAMHNKANTASLLLSLSCKISHNEQDFTPIDYALHYKHSEVAMVMVTHPSRNSYGMYFHMLNLAVYTVFLSFLTTNAVQLMAEKTDRENFTQVTSAQLASAFVYPSTRAKYFLDIMNVLEWTLYISAGLMAAGHLSTAVVDRSNQYIMAALAVFLAWFNYLLYLQRFNRIGLYVVMFLEILSTLLKVMFVFFSSHNCLWPELPYSPCQN
ncbi:hypothetical protein MRX96_052215 [Rhipicephalus microplus]